LRDGDENLKDELMEEYEELIYETDIEEPGNSPSSQRSDDDSNSQCSDNEWSHHTGPSHHDSDIEERQLQMAIEASLAECRHTPGRMNGLSPWYVEDAEDDDMAMAIEASLADADQALGQANRHSVNNDAHTTSFWPKVQRWLKDRVGPKPVVTCFAFDRELVIRGLQEDDGHRELPLILGCGHVVGEACLSQLVDRARVDSTDVECPYCGKAIVTGVL
jgi:hypothetical protein